MRHLTAFFFALTLTLNLAAHVQAQSTSSPAPWPTRGWPTSTPEAQGIDSEQLASAIESARKNNLNIHSLLVVRNGYLVAEAYFYPYDGQSPHDIASVTKGITATLIGQAIAQGKIKRAALRRPFSKMCRAVTPRRRLARPVADRRLACLRCPRRWLDPPPSWTGALCRARPRRGASLSPCRLP